VKCYAALAVVVVVVLALTGVWNPWPGVWTWVNRSEPIAAPVAAWQQKLGGAAQSVAVTDAAVVVEYRTKTEAFGTRDGVPLWESDADWSAVAGSGRTAVVVTGELLTRGYQVRDPGTGSVRRTDTEALAVWTYADALLDVRCRGADDCELRFWEPHGTAARWTVAIPGVGFVVFADNPPLPGVRTATGDQFGDQVTGPGPLPGLLGFPAGDRLHLVDTAAGRVARVVDAGRRERLVPAGHRLLTSTARAADGTCYFAVSAIDPAAGTAVWRADGLNLRTVGARAGCEQDRDPVGSREVLIGVRPDGREVLTDAHDGTELWTGAADERVLGVDDRRAVIRSADGRSLTCRPFAAGEPGWRRSADPAAQAVVTAAAVLVVDRSPRRVLALHPGDGTVLTEARTDARVLATGDRGLVVGQGRAIAYLPFGTGG
jgi:hypothetical protein